MADFENWNLEILCKINFHQTVRIYYNNADCKDLMK
jgi:hypothetical protein